MGNTRLLYLVIPGVHHRVIKCSCFVELLIDFTFVHTHIIKSGNLIEKRLLFFGYNSFIRFPSSLLDHTKAKIQ